VALAISYASAHGADTLASDEVAIYWRYIAQSIDGLLATVEGLSAAQLNWHPPAADANSLYALARHTVGNIEQKLLDTLCGLPVVRSRETEFATVGENPLALHHRWQELPVRLHDALAALTADDMVTSRMPPGPRLDPGQRGAVGADIQQPAHLPAESPEWAARCATPTRPCCTRPASRSAWCLAVSAKLYAHVTARLQVEAATQHSACLAGEGAADMLPSRPAK
jgi:hypothetical protein